MTRCHLFLDNAESAERLRVFGELLDGISRRLNLMVAHAEHDPATTINTELKRQLAMLEEACAEFNLCADKLDAAHCDAVLENH